MSERWKDVVGYEGLYQVSDHGRVKSRARVVPSPDRSVQKIKERILKPWAYPRGHLMVNLHKDGKQRGFYVHKLVLEAFVGLCPDGMECRHYPDSDPTNNRLDNIQWGTRKENAKDMVEHGNSTKGERCSAAKLNEQKVRKIRKLYATGKYTQQQLADMFGVWQPAIGSVVRRATWRHV